MAWQIDRRGRRSIRRPEHDYSSPGAYFVTICVREKELLFGDICSGVMRLNTTGKIVWRVWTCLPSRFEAIVLDSFVVMPNHVHGLLWIADNSEPPSSTMATSNESGPLPDILVGAIHELPPDDRSARRRMLLPRVIGYFKTTTAKEINNLRGNSGLPVWQRNYHEHIVRGDGDLVRIRRYIADNPTQWDEDEEHPLHQRSGSEFNR